MNRANGSFEVKIVSTTHAPDPTISSRSLDKVYSGDLEAIAKGEMLSAGDPSQGNAGYVAMERVTGKLNGKTGTFALMQAGTMTTGSDPKLTISTVPGSGTGELSGISGTMTIVIEGGKHSYAFEYGFGK